MKLALVLALMVQGHAMGQTELLNRPNPYENPALSLPQTRVDELVLPGLKQDGIEPPFVCSDGVFIRRAFLDAIGTLPTALEVGSFLLDRKPDKRRLLIDKLLERDEFADYWSLKWCDLLRVKAEFPINLWPNAVQAYHRWIRTAIKENMPYDRFAFELLTSSGSNFRTPQVNFYRAMQNKDPRGMAAAVALTFMGCRAEKWPGDRWSEMAVFFSQLGTKRTAEWKEEILFFDPAKAPAKTLATARFPDGKPARLDPDRDAREPFARWLIDPENPWFKRNIANRVWCWLLGRGIIHEPDDIRPDNPPANPELLVFLEQELVAAHYDLKHLYRLILNSKTYQLSPVLGASKPGGEAHFALYRVRRLEAEVLIDALNQITGGAEKYTSPIPEPFTFIPETQRSIALGDGSTTSPFLEMFGRPARDTGLESERNNATTASQRMHLLNSSHVRQKIEQSRMVAVQSQPKRTPRDIARDVYPAILSRFPTKTETETVEAYFQSGELTRREAVTDLVWALINSAEFWHRH